MMFEPFEGIPDYPQLEKSILQFWEEHKIFDKLREKNRGGEPWRFQDGPITANNPMGVHHAWGRTYKDIFQRYYAMRGRKLRWQNGFDCQGLWVEVEVEKELGFKGKPDIVAFGLENFSRECRKRVDQFATVITEQSKRLGQWMDWDRSYYTFDDSNIEHIWGFLKKCHEEGWLAQDYRVMPWCPRCETSLSQHESADSYKEITHRSVYLKFPIVGEIPGYPPEKFDNKPINFLVWTTTPWTLTANVALAINPKVIYAFVKDEGEILVLANQLRSSALRQGAEEYAGDFIPGSGLVGLSYSGPFDDLPAQQKMNAETPRRTVAWEEVGETEGTGIVHIAPGCGAEDFELGKREGLGFIVPVDTEARFLPGCGPLAGLHALDDVKTIFAGLRDRDRLYRIQKYTHSYPVCWRCGQELIFYATQEWFIKADAGPRPARERLRRAARTVRWVPEYAGKRMDDWLANMGDWCISRKRFWGLPLPFYVGENGVLEVIGSRAELRERAATPEMVDALPELHRPWIDEIEIRSRDGRHTLRRVPEVGDAWLDAGIVPYSTLGYNGATDLRMPPEIVDETIQTHWKNWFPADFITEMREQVRLWFFSMLFMSVALEDCAPYRAAMVYETMLDEEGRRFSKTKGIGVNYEEVIGTVGADPMRWTFCGNPLNKDIRFGYRPIHEAQRRLLTLWNVYSFFVTYANLDKPELNSSILRLSLRTNQQPSITNVLDRWILARLQQLIGDVTAALEQIEPANITRATEKFVDDLSTWYVRRSRRRFWKGENDADKLAAYQTLHTVLLTLCKLIAPVIPFTAEAIYQNLKRPLADAPESVHLCAWPEVDESWRDADLLAEMDDVLQVVSLGHAARKAANVRVRQPLARVLVQAPLPEARSRIERWRDTILDELNVKALELLEDTGELVSYSLRANLPKLGPKFGKKIGAIRQALEKAEPADARRIAQAVRSGENVTLQIGGEELELAADEVLVQTHQQSGYHFETENGWAVGLDTTLNDDLIDEGLARDFVRAVQNLRKEAGFEVSDHIALLLADPRDDSRMPQVLEKFGDYVQQETLADELRLVDPDYPGLSEVKIGDETIRIGVERLPATSE
ncbi:MAG: isoleucine--tRNA ligase [Armatimonadota bacterium]|nr:isoleucine--tRNA ligase [Armatimonadota bacterium]